MHKKFKDVSTSRGVYETLADNPKQVAKPMPPEEKARLIKANANAFKEAAAESGVTELQEAEKKEQPEVISLQNQIIVLLEKSRDQTATLNRILQETGAKRKILLQTIRRHLKKDFPRYRRKGTYALVLCSGISKPRDIDWATLKIPDIPRIQILPEPLRGILGPVEGLLKNSFIVKAGLPDTYKTADILNCAQVIAKDGGIVQLINHETDDYSLVKLLAQREVGHVVPAEKALEICRDTDWIRRIKVRTATEQQIEELDLTGIDVLCWDYMNASFLRCDNVGGAGSPYSKYVQTIGQHVVDKGIPVVTAVQQFFGEGGVKASWFERATIALIVEEVERGDEESVTDMITYRILKNKPGPCHDFVDVHYSKTTQMIVEANSLSKQGLAERRQAKKDEAQKKRDEAKKEIKDLRKQQKERDEDKKWKNSVRAREDLRNARTLEEASDGFQ